MTDFVLRAGRRLQSSAFRIYDDQTLLGQGFVVEINSQGSFLDPSVSNTLSTRADNTWGIKDLFENPLNGRRIGPHRIAATPLGAEARRLFREYDPLTPFHVWIENDMAFAEDPIYAGRDDIFPLGDLDHRYALVRGVGPDVFEFLLSPVSVEQLKSQGRGHFLHADRGLAQGPRHLMLVDLWGEDGGQTGQALLAGETDFGEVEVGKWERRTLTVTNTGSGVLSIRAVEVPPGYRPQWRAALIAPGSSRELVLHFNPREVGLFEGEIVLHTNGVDPVISLYVAGWGIPSASAQGRLILVQGGTLPARDELGELHVGTFELGQYEVTWRLWKEVRNWAVSRGYDLLGSGAGCRDTHPVHSVSWYDVVKWCNARSEREGLQPVYELNGQVFRRGNFEWQPSGHITRNVFANGYRLPTEIEWAYAARGGPSTLNFTYAGGNNPDTVAWHSGNSAGARCGLYQDKGTWPVGRKRANELGFYDMSGNVDEWLDDHLEEDEWMEFMDRRARGGNWLYSPPAHALTVRGEEKNAHAGDFLTGFRVARNDPAAVLRILVWEGDLDFGPVPVGLAATRNLILRNTGEVPLIVTRLRYPAGYSGDWTGGFIEAGGFRVVTVTFAPTEARTYGGLIRAETSATAGAFSHPVDGEGIGAPEPEHTTLVTGGSLPGISRLGALEVDDFHIGTWEVTWGEWKHVRDWAADHGYDLANSGDGCADDHPVHSVSWYDAVKWCNAFSEMEGRTPAYNVGSEVYRAGDFGWDGSGVIHWNTAANGYRLPTAAEWEFAARGGNASQGYTYSGSDHLNLVAWYWANASGAFCDMIMGRGTWPVGTKEPNELGLFDMSGNIAEWVWDPDIAYGDLLRWSYGGSWSTVGPEGLALTTTGEGAQNPDSAWDFQGLRIARGAGVDAPGALSLSGPPAFGKVGLGTSVARTLTLSNTGSVPVGVANWLFSADFWLDGAVETIDPGQSVDVDILFVPTEIGVVDTWGLLHTNAGVHAIPLTGEGVPLSEPPLAPFAIDPQDGASFVDGERAPTLRWSSSMSLDRPRHYDYLYFHTDLTAVESRHPMALVAGDGLTAIGDEWTAPAPLQPGTTYYWRVVNGNAGGETVGDVWSFTTLSPVTTYPYFEGFDDKGFEPPAGWSNQWSFDLSGADLEPTMGGGWGPAYDDALIFEGAGAYTANSWSMPAYYWLVSPPFALPAGATLRFHVYYQWTPEEPTELFLRVLVNGVWQPWVLWADAAHTNLYAEEAVLDLAAFAGQQVRFAFIYNAAAWGSPVAIDALFIEAE
ncbi:MAG: SUMF1/EgtB/PvdO family nonheme iron enzyme [Opitutales bacterium]|nr:SUMF1/EgtB/PvdO family nonheme iron enzyme [Opitutales bacterium]